MKILNDFLLNSIAMLDQPGDVNQNVRQQLLQFPAAVCLLNSSSKSSVKLASVRLHIRQPSDTNYGILAP